MMLMPMKMKVMTTKSGDGDDVEEDDDDGGDDIDTEIDFLLAEKIYELKKQEL